MQRNRYFPLSLIAAAVLAGCSTVPPQNSTLDEARASYSSAQINPDVVSLAPVELKRAGDSLGRADAALNKGESETTVNHLAYLAKQQVAIAEETAKRKIAEREITTASAQRDQIRLAARTAEADAARRQAETARQAAEEQAARDRARIAAEAAKVEEARRQAEEQAARDRALLAAEAAKVEEARRQAEEQAARDRALIAQQEAQLKELEAKKTERGMVITLGDVLFSVNKADLSPGGMRNVSKLADFLKQYPERKVLIEGHTDSTGSQSLNQALSERRADAVRSALVDMGIDGSRIQTRGYAFAYPVANNATPAGRQLNRRVEIVLSDDSGNIISR